MKNNIISRKGCKLIVEISLIDGWKRYQFDGTIIFFKGFSVEAKVVCNKIFSYINNHVDEPNKIINYIEKINGNFSIVIQTSKLTIVAVDCIRSIPLFYLSLDDSIIVSNDVDYLKKNSPVPMEISNDAEIQISMSGYSSCKKTLYKNIKSMIPGEVFYSNIKNSYYEYNANNYDVLFNKSNDSIDKLQENFNQIIVSIMTDTIKLLKGRQIVVPLSAGYDSRLIVSLLKQLGYSNVVCFTYGMRNNHEAVTAKSIAEALGFKWYFIELNIKEQKSFYKSKEFLNYIAYADTADAVPYYQGLYSVKFLKENKIISNDAVFISGNSGDFITGGHSSLYDKSCGAHSISEHFVKRIIKKHYSLWGNLKTKNNKRLIGDMIKRDYNIFSERYSIDFDACDFAYYYELVNRQSKYVVQGQKVYEYYGFDWALPLWDKRLLLFWSSVPYAYNKDQFLYKKTIMNYNYSDVWGEDFTVNKTKINSYILRYFRYLAKTLSLLFSVGNIEFWNNVDRVFFLYYYDITRMMCSVRYYNIISSFFKHPRHNVSFDALKYIADHKKKLLKQSNSEI